MSLTNEDKAHIIQLIEGVVQPQTGMERHFIGVCKGEGRACTPIEREWVAYWAEYTRKTSHSIRTNTREKQPPPIQEITSTPETIIPEQSPFPIPTASNSQKQQHDHDAFTEKVKSSNLKRNNQKISPKQIEYDGKLYTWTGTRWYETKTFLEPPQVIINTLNGLLRPILEEEDENMTDIQVLLDNAKGARESKQFQRAEKLIHRVLEVVPDHLGALAILSSILRTRGAAQQALDMTDAKKGKQPPAGFEPAQEPDEKTGHWPGWLPVSDIPDDKYHRAAFNGGQFDNGTYELCGPKVQGNPEKFEKHALIRHGIEPLPDCPRDYDGLKAYFQTHNIEGIVWHHPDGRMVKIKGKDFGIRRK